nr:MULTISPECIES: hypothetical protein [unclassified Nonomuraea]
MAQFAALGSFLVVQQPEGVEVQSDPTLAGGAFRWAWEQAMVGVDDLPSDREFAPVGVEIDPAQPDHLGTLSDV